MSTEPAEPGWFVYVLRTRDGHLYTGISTDPERRLREHESGKLGAKSLRGKGPLRLEWYQQVSNRSEASQIEARIKKLTKAAKELLLAEKITLTAANCP